MRSHRPCSGEISERGGDEQCNLNAANVGEAPPPQLPMSMLLDLKPDRPQANGHRRGVPRGHTRRY